MSIGIVAFLEPTQVWFMEQRLFWAMIIVSFGLTMSKDPAPPSLPAVANVVHQHPANPSSVSF
jgi:hypothetical protein